MNFQSNHLLRILDREMPRFLPWLSYAKREHPRSMVPEKILAFYSKLLGRTFSFPSRPITNQWQHTMWNTLHATAFYVQENPKYLKDFFMMMAYLNVILPCASCKYDYYTIHRDGVLHLLRGLVDPGYVIAKLHNDVAKQIGRPIYLYKHTCNIFSVDANNGIISTKLSREEFIRRSNAIRVLYDKNFNANRYDPEFLWALDQNIDYSALGKLAPSLREPPLNKAITAHI